ncbi:MAG: hypothetical protein WKF89_19125 [Chitinophagaceae bacterium]
MNICYYNIRLALVHRVPYSMTCQQFQLLHEYEQEEIVFEKGIFLGNYVRANKICDVYQLSNYYVKCCYLLSIQGKAMITAFTRPDNLPFLKDIDISGL